MTICWHGNPVDDDYAGCPRCSEIIRLHKLRFGPDAMIPGLRMRGKMDTLKAKIAKEVQDSAVRMAVRLGLDFPGAPKFEARCVDGLVTVIRVNQDGNRGPRYFEIKVKEMM